MSTSNSATDASPETFVLFSLACACASRSPAKVMFAVVSTMERALSFAVSRENAGAPVCASSPGEGDWRIALRYHALDLAKVADEAGVAMADYADLTTRGYDSFAEFMTDFVDGDGQAPAIMPVHVAGGPCQNHDASLAPTRPGYLIGDAIDQWVEPAAPSEQSRRGSAVRQFVDAVGFGADAPISTLASIPPRAADLFLRHAAAHPLKPRGEQNRLAHIDKFLAAMRDAGIPIPPVDWDAARARGVKSK